MKTIQTNQLVKDPILLPSFDLRGHRWAKIKQNHSVIIGGKTYIPYQTAWDKDLKEYIWKFRQAK